MGSCFIHPLFSLFSPSSHSEFQASHAIPICGWVGSLQCLEFLQSGGVSEGSNINSGKKGEGRRKKSQSCLDIHCRFSFFLSSSFLSSFRSAGNSAQTFSFCLVGKKATRLLLPSPSKLGRGRANSKNLF